MQQNLLREWSNGIVLAIVAMFALGCASESTASGQSERKTLADVSPFRIEVEDYLENEAPTRVALTILPAHGLFKAPHCPTVEALQVKLNGIDVRTEPGRADVQHDIHMNEKIVCQSPGAAWTPSDGELETGDYDFQISDGSKTAQLKVHIDYAAPKVELVAPADGKLHVGDTVTLRAHPSTKAQTDSLVVFHTTGGMVGFTRSGTDLQWTDGAMVTFVVPQTAPSDGMLELRASGWDEPTADACEGASSCAVTVNRAGAVHMGPMIAAQVVP